MRRSRAARRRPLAGVPYAVKNLFDIDGVVDPRRLEDQSRQPAGARRRHPRRADEGRPAPSSSARLNMGEYAYDFTGENAHDGASRNPHDPSRMSGGSSGGSGTAVAAGMVAASLGSDTNGSIRVPSSFCGLFGLKPTFGRLSRAGTFPFCASLDHLGPMARSARDLALLFDALQGDDPARPGAGPAARRSRRTAEIDKGVDGSADRRRRRLFPRSAACRRPSPPSTRSRPRSAPSATRDAPGGDAGASRGLCHHHGRSRRRCISTVCRPAPATSIPTCATGCSPAPWCRRHG